jgi:tetratricopeptide (TPR) repeat protein
MACLLILLVACGGERGRLEPQLGILRFENLSSNASLDWMGRGFSEILCGELDGSPRRYTIQWRALHAFDASTGSRPAAAPGISAERPGALLAGANEIVYGDFSVVNGMLRATAMQEDVGTRKIVKVVSASGPVANGIFPVADALARQLGQTRPFGSQNADALRAYVAGLEASDPAAALRDFSQAAADDPDFGRAYVYWLDTAVAQRNREEADRALAQARGRMDRIPELDRLRLSYGATVLDGDFNARTRALTALARFDPSNPNNHRALGQMLMSIRKYDEAITEFRRALSIQPEDIVSLNSMGYAAAYSGDLPTAIRALRGYEQLRPAEPNPLDSLGDVHFALGHYSEAEQFYLAARTKSPAFLNGGEFLKAAQARLMTGDVTGATAVFKRCLAERQAAQDPFIELYAAAWAWQTGDRRPAIQRLDKLAAADESGPLREVASRANAQAAIWLLELGDRAGAAERARKSMAEAAPASAEFAVVATFLTQPETDAAGWTARADNAFPQPQQAGQRDYARAYAFLFTKQFEPAAQVLKQIYDRPTSELDDGLSVLLAWAYEETGRWQSAEPLLRINPLPQAAGLPMFASLYFPRLFFLRGALLDSHGNRNQALPNYRLFLLLSGKDVDIWGEQQRAAAAAGQGS